MPPEMKKIVLFFPVISPLHTEQNVPLSLLALAGPLQQKGYTVRIIDARVERDYVKLLKEEIADALCVGITMFTGDQIHYALEVCRLIKAARPELPVIAGGWHPSIEPRSTLEHPAIDIVVRGQGESSLCELAEHLETKQPLSDVRGISYKENGVIRENPDRPLEDFNSFPPMPYELVNMEAYLQTARYPREALYMSSRGCPFSCSFCSIAVIYKRAWQALNPERVVAEVEQLVRKFGALRVKFFDDCFTIDLNRVKAICRGLIEKNLGIVWSCQVRAADILRFDDELWQLLHESRCVHFLMGLESGSQRMLDKIAKHSKASDAIVACRLIKERGFDFGSAFIFGLPGESWGDVKQTLDFICALRRLDPEAAFSFFFYTPYPGTASFDEAVKLGLRKPATLEEWSRFTVTRINIPWVDSRRIDKMRMILRFYFPLAFPVKELKAKINALGWPFKAMFNSLRPLGYLRMKFMCFCFPFEWWIYRSFLKIWQKREEFFAKRLPGEF
jgi:anaerobic magnesium-protoporphyrin IX monomethyl ester cyclase